MYIFTKSLKKGDTDDGVLMLQKTLNLSVDTAVSPTGAGSKGQETNYFGAMTENAVMRFQEKNKLTKTGMLDLDTRTALQSFLYKLGDEAKNYSIDSMGIAMLKEFEGCNLRPYQDGGKVWTIGYGSTYLMDGSKVTANTAPITLQQAEDLLIKKIANQYAPAVQKKVTARITQSAFNALVSFAYNLGTGDPLTDIANKINAGKLTRKDWVRYCHDNGKEVVGLLIRRNKEADVYGI